MKALTIWQPWATLCVTPRVNDPSKPAKEFETRGWATKHRGVLAIHAAKRWTEDGMFLTRTLDYRDARTGCQPWGPNPLPFGCIVGLVDLVDCLPTSTEDGRRCHPWTERLSPAERAFGDFSFCRYGWRLANPRPLPEPVPAVGKQGLWTLDDELLRAIARHVRLDAEALR
ncbi:ASCH domain-containing protein [Paludisphaera soli]|uniref:ASCH domain-containing protein n=1 Tax=Paludisphaera soli TaxID=2712865 RepID=UPI0013ED0DBE|nr:ASCH domain-containing protein [Paludisphaera soli]